LYADFKNANLSKWQNAPPEKELKLINRLLILRSTIFTFHILTFNISSLR
jgi:hypothetical protein